MDSENVESSKLETLSQSEPTSNMEAPPRSEPYIQPVDGIVQPPVEPPPGRPGRKTNVLESLKTVLKQIMKNSLSFYFRHPVDAVALAIPSYHNLIRHPMDLATISKRLQNNYYWQADEALDDFELIFENCMLYNEESTDVYKAAKELRDVFYTRLAYIDMNNEMELKPKAVKAKKKPEPIVEIEPDLVTTVASNITLDSEDQSEHDSTFEPEPEPETDIDSDTDTDTDIDTDPEPEPEAEPEQKVPLDPHKFHTYPSQLIEWQNYLIEKTHCEHLLKIMTKSKHSEHTWPFQCADLWRQYAQNPNYDHDAVEKLDWQILRNKLEQNQFKDLEDFSQKVRIMFQNALTCFPANKFLVASVNEAFDIFEDHLEQCKISIAESKNRIQLLAAEKMKAYDIVLSELSEEVTKDDVIIPENTVIDTKLKLDELNNTLDLEK